MSMETELKKIAINLQQLTDAVTTLTAVMEIHKPLVIPTPDDTVNLHPVDMTNVGENKSVLGTTDVVDTVVDINKNTTDAADPAKTVVTAMTLAEANAELQRLVGVIGDGGVSIRDLLKSHNAISLAQIPVENYASLITEAQELVPGQQA